jgi:hypothetical protein
MSALPPIADIRRRGWHVRYVPLADTSARQVIPCSSRRHKFGHRAIAEWHGLPLDIEDEAAEVIAKIRAHIPHVQDNEIDSLFEWIRMLRETGARPMPMA